MTRWPQAMDIVHALGPRNLLAQVASPCWRWLVLSAMAVVAAEAGVVVLGCLAQCPMLG
jgi:hypothetical protein